MNVKTSFPLSAIAASAVLWAGSAGATLISQTFLFGPPSISFAEPMASPTFDLFDSVLGTLDSVRIELDATITGDTTLQKQSSGAAITPGGSVTRTLTLDLSTLGLSDLTISDIDNWETTLPTGSVASSTRTQSVNTFASVEVTSSAAPILAIFTGLGTVSFDLNGLIINSLTGSGFNVMALTAAAVGDITLTYDFTPQQNGNGDDPAPVPEPATLALIALGLLGVGVLRRRRHETG